MGGGGWAQGVPNVVQGGVDFMHMAYVSCARTLEHIFLLIHRGVQARFGVLGYHFGGFGGDFGPQR